MFYLLVIALTVLASGLWNRDATVPIGFGIDMPVNGLLRDFVLICDRARVVDDHAPIAPRRERLHLGADARSGHAVRRHLHHHDPDAGDAEGGHEGPFAPLLALVSTPDGTPIDAAYFWMTGILSSFLDNAPTYLVFFNLAGGDAQELMGPLYSTLLAISAGAVFMGAMTYIGNAPNFMVRSICEERGIKMPSFIGYMLWSGAILLPLFAVFTWIWFL